MVANNQLLVLLIKLLRGIEVVDLLDVDLLLFLGGHNLIENLAKLVFKLISLWLGHIDSVVIILRVNALVSL